MAYPMVTVKLNRAPVKSHDERGAAFEEIKKVFGLAFPEIDEDYGAIPMPDIVNGKICYKDEYIVCIEPGVAAKLQKDRHPNIIQVWENPQMGIEPFGAPKKPSGPRF